MRIPGHQKRSYTWRWTAALVGLAVVAFALVMALVVAPASRVEAATYAVNIVDTTLVGGTTGHADEADLALDGTCDANAAAGNQCTLRAAIQEANNSTADDIITVPTAGQITVAAALPTIADDDLTINGGGCVVSAGVAMTLLTINADRVTVNSLVIDGEGVGTTGVSLSATTDDAVLNSLTVRGFTGDGISTTAGGKRNTIQNSTVTSNDGNGIALNGGDDNTVGGNTITNNGDAVGAGCAGDYGVVVPGAEDDLTIQGNLISGNFDAQICVSGLVALNDLVIIQNTIVVSSDGIQVDGVAPTADIDIGLTVANRNVFRGPLGSGEYRVINFSAADINAENNEWNNYDVAGVDAVVCHDFGGTYTPPENDATCLALLPGNGIVDFVPFVGTPSPLATPTPTPGPATSTPTITPTPTPGTPTSTPTATGTPATATPTATPVMESVTLVVGCNPVASTYADNTAISTIASAVSPSGALISIWAFETGVWRGYSPFYPEYSDLSAVDRLDVVFICVDTAGSFERPEV